MNTYQMIVKDFLSILIVTGVVEWNFKKGDRWGFAVVLGEYYLKKDKPASVTISNNGVDGFIVADGIGFKKIE